MLPMLDSIGGMCNISPCLNILFLRKGLDLEEFYCTFTIDIKQSSIFFDLHCKIELDTSEIEFDTRIDALKGQDLSAHMAVSLRPEKKRHASDHLIIRTNQGHLNQTKS